MRTFNKNIQVRNLGFNQVATIVVPSFNTWKSEVQSKKGFRIKVIYPVNSLIAPDKIRLTVSTCKAFVDLTSDKSSITMNQTGGILECIYDAVNSSPYVNLNPNGTHFINIKNKTDRNVNFDVELDSFETDVRVACTSGPITPGFTFEPVKNQNKSSLIQDFSVGQVASLVIPPKDSSDWGSAKPSSVRINLSYLDGLPSPGKWEMIISECPGSFEESLPTSVGSVNDYHLISNRNTGQIDIDYI